MPHFRRMLKYLRYSLRQLLKTPGFFVAATLTIALGMGANTAIFSVINAVLLRSLPVPGSQHLVLFHLSNQPLTTSQSGYDDTSLSLPVYQAMRNRHDLFSDVVAFAPLGFDKTPIRYGKDAEEAHGELVSGNFFSGLEVQTALGRGLTVLDESQSAPVVVLSYRWWQARFNGARDVLGRVLYVKGVPLTIVGVAQRGFDGSDPGQPDMDFWIPFQKESALSPWGNPPGAATLYGSPKWLCLLMIGRLKPNVSVAQATAALTPQFVRTLAETAGVDPRDRKPQLVFSPIHGIETLRDDFQRPLEVLAAMVLLVLLIASANVAMLLLLRNSAKAREFALRRALGANTRVLFLQLLTESSLLVAAGAALGWLLANSATAALSQWSGLDIVVEPDRQVLLFTLALATVVAIAFGLLPMRIAGNPPLAETLKRSTATAQMDRRRLWVRKLVIVMQVSLCAVLLFAGELLYATLRNLESSNLGLRTTGLVVFGITPPSHVRTDAEAARFHLGLLESFKNLPGVDHATVSGVRLGTGGSNNDGVLVDGKNPLPAKPVAPMGNNEVGSQFLQTLGIRLQLGRDFDDADIEGAKVAIINQTFADRYLPHTNPLNHQIAFFEDPKTAYTIVGVARNSRYTAVNERDRPVAYFPFTQVSGISAMQYEVHTASIEPAAVLAMAAKVVHAVDPNVALEKPITQREQFDQTISRERLVARLSICFAFLAMFLVAIGLYGTISYSVNRRQTEIGVRIALGAQRNALLGMVLRESAALTLGGLGIGLPLALVLAHTLRSITYGLSSADPVAFLVAIAGIIAVTAFATVLPARRAASVDPVLAIRAE